MLEVEQAEMTMKMDAEQLKRFEARLRELQAEIEQELGRADAEAKPVQVDGAMGRVSRGDALQVHDMALDKRRRREQQLLRVHAALRRAEQGSFGLCGRCNRPIAEARLEAAPDAVLCVDCAAEKTG